MVKTIKFVPETENVKVPEHEKAMVLANVMLDIKDQPVINAQLGIVSNNMSKIFGYKHFKQKFYHRIGNFFQKISTCLYIGSNLKLNC